MRVLACSALLGAVLVSTACTSAERYVERGQIAFDAGKYDEASLDFRKAIQKNQNLGIAYYKLGLTQLRQRNLRDAYQTLSRASSLLPKDQEAQVTFGDLCLQLYQADAKRPKALYDHVTKVVAWLSAKDPNGYDALRFQGYVAIVDRKLPEGIEDLEKANRLKPYELPVVLPLMQALVQSQRFAEAEKLAQDTIRQHKDYVPVYDELYRYYMAANRFDQAEGILKSKIASNPKRAEFTLELANLYSRVHKDAEANALIKDMLDHASDYPNAYLLTGSYYAQTGNLAEATRLLEEGAKQHPEQRVVYEKGLVDILLVQDKKQEAARMVDGILQEAPKDNDALRLRALLLMDTRSPENIDKALAELQDVVQQTPADVMSRFYLARAHLMKGELENARKDLTECLRHNPRFLAAHSMLAEVMLLMRQPQEVLTQASAVLAVQPGNPRARLLEVIALTSAGRSVEAHNRLSALIKDQPQYVDAQLELGFLDFREKKYPESEAVFRKLYEAGQGGPRAMEGLLQVLSARGQNDQILRILDAEVKKPLVPVSTRILLAQAEVRAGRNDAAIDQLQQAVKQDPKSYEANLMLGDYFRGKGQLTQAIAMYQIAADAAPRNPAPELLLAQAQDQAGRKPEAIKAFREAVARQPDNPVALNDLAFYLAENGGNLDEALTLSRHAVERVKNQPNLSDTLGWIYLKKNMPDDALQIFNNLAKKSPGNPVFQFHLGAALAAKGDKTGARTALGTALRNKPSQQDEAKIRELLARLG